jgi:hypothetical protein
MHNARGLTGVPEAWPFVPDLGNFRLVRILAGAEEEPISCSVERFSLCPCPNYTALSYFCGDPSITETILINGIQHEVTTNLASFLRHYRSGDPARAMELCWIDTICNYQDRYRSKCCRNLRFEPLFCEGVGSAHLAALSRGAQKSSNFFASLSA